MPHNYTEPAKKRSEAQQAKINAKVEKITDAALKLYEDGKAEVQAERMENTAKRIAQACNARTKGRRMMRAGLISSAYAKGLLEDDLPGFMADWKWTRKAALEIATQTSKATANGYHTYYSEDGEYADKSQIADYLRNLTDLSSIDKAGAMSQEIAQLRMATIPGFFPTPKPVADVMIEHLGHVIESGEGLEPSAGKGDLCQAAIDAGARFIDAVEVDSMLANVLPKTVTPNNAISVHHQDFLSFNIKHRERGYDFVIMNPPFERVSGQGWQYLSHAQHAIKMLAHGGRLVCVLPGNWETKNDKQTEEFLKYLDESGRNWHTADLPEDSFANAFKSTKVSTCLLVVEGRE